MALRPLSDGSGSNTCNSQSPGSVCNPAWEAGAINDVNSLFPGGNDQRKVFTYDPARALGDRGRQFEWADLGAQQRASLRDGDSITIGQQRLDYIRGSNAQEESLGGIFRDRAATRLGAVVHSSPRYVGNGFQASGRFDLVYPDGVESSGINHRDFICSNPVDSDNDGLVDSCSSGIRSRTPLVFVGSNDGMLHAYKATPNTGAGGGQEVFSYIPNAVYPRIHQLSDTTFINGSSVDGDMDIRDVFYGNAWHTLLVGGLRTGGQAYYALDITDPDQIISGAQDNTLAQPLARWEFSDTDTTGLASGTPGVNGDSDLGYTYGAPVIGKSNDDLSGSSTGRWVAIFGGGFNATVADGSASATGSAVIFIVDAETGLLVKKFDTGVGSIAQPNGIADVTPIFNDSNSGLTFDYIYAGDLYGNIWKIDISSDDVTDWDFAYRSGGAPVPLFNANIGGVAQPITSTPVVGEHPLGGNIVYFGTGRYLEDTDSASTTQQSFYAIWDKDQCTAGPCSDASLSGVAKTHIVPSINRSDLLAQSVNVSGTNSRTTTDLQVDWSTQQGWYLDMVAANGERAIGKAVLNDRNIFFTTIDPDSDQCSSGGDSWLYALDRVDGGRPYQQVFDHNSDGEVDSGDYLSGDVTSASRVAGIASDPTIILGNDNLNFGLLGTSDSSSSNVHTESIRKAWDGHRVRWRQIK